MTLNNNGNGSSNGNGQHRTQDLDLTAFEGQSRESLIQQYAAQLGLDEDDPAMVFVRANASLEGKVELWNTIILELVKTSREQSRAMQETAENSLKLQQVLERSAADSQQLRAQISKLEHTLSQSLREGRPKPSAGLNQSAVQSLMPQFQKVNSELGEINDKLDRNRQTVRSHAAGNVNRQQWTQALLVMNLVMLIGVFGFSAFKAEQLRSGQRYLSSQSSWLLTKLARVEDALGIKPGK